MSRKKRDVLLHLTGGLGNELFQVAAALHASNTRSIDIEWALGKPRVNEKNLPQIECYELPATIRLAPKKRDSFIARKSLGYVLRSGISPKGIENNFFYRRFVNLIVSTLMILRNKEFRRIFGATDIGYSLIPRFRWKYLVGYFQSYKYVADESVYLTMYNLKARNFENYMDYVNLSIEEKPLVVHVRLADYFKEVTFGILSKEYYQKAISIAWESGTFKRIWLFSDEPEKAIEWIPLEFHKYVHPFGDIENCIVKTLEVMRLGHGYVMANSSFSWWAARLSHSKSPLVIAPKPWFKSQAEPKDLIPKEWQRINGWPNTQST